MHTSTQGFTLGAPELKQVPHPNLIALIKYYSKTKGILHCPLQMETNNATYAGKYKCIYVYKWLCVCV